MENVRIGFVGTGGIAGHHMGKLKELEGVQFAAMCDVVPDRAAERAGEHGCPCPTFTDYRRMLEEVEMDGPKEGEVPPDFFLKRQGSDERVRLSDFQGKRAVALVFGSYT